MDVRALASAPPPGKHKKREGSCFFGCGTTSAAGHRGTDAHADAAGIACAVVSGALTSGVGYAIWSTALPHLRAASAATVQLSVPAIAAIAGIVLLGEAPTWRLLFASLAILGGIALVVRSRLSGGR